MVPWASGGGPGGHCRRVPGGPADQNRRRGGGVSLHLEAGAVTEESEAGCPEGTTIIVRDLFFNTPARMKFMKQDSVEGAAAASAVQRQALAHPQVAVRLLRDGKEILNTPGDGQLLSAMAGVYGREAANLVPVDSHWEKSEVRGFVSKPTQARASRAYQIFFVNGRPVKSKLLQSALEEAYRNQLMVGKFPACVLHLQVPPHTVDVNVHPAKTEVKFLSEREAFDCIHYGVLAALNKAQDRPQLHPEPGDAGGCPCACPPAGQAGGLSHHVRGNLPADGCGAGRWEKAKPTEGSGRRSRHGAGPFGTAGHDSPTPEYSPPGAACGSRGGP
ncbi:MAG: DNA mismatch repair endonuclease MutL [Oscillospiraceae bacterium]